MEFFLPLTLDKIIITIFNQPIKIGTIQLIYHPSIQPQYKFEPVLLWLIFA